MANLVVMERAEAEAVLDGDREVAVVLLMRVGELVLGRIGGSRLVSVSLSSA